MIDQKLLEYVRAQLSSGLAASTLRENLQKAGWALSIVDEAIGLATSGNVPSPEIPPVKYAGFWIRYAASFIDGIILNICIFIVTFLIGLNFKPQFADQKLITIASVVFSLLVQFSYFVFMTDRYETTLGKKALGLIVKSDTGNKLTIGQVLMREVVGKILSTITFFVGYIMVAFTAKKQGLHDKLAHSVVVYKNPNERHTGKIIAIVIIVVIFVAIAIVGILASVVLTSLNSARGIARDASVESTLRYMQTSAEVYYLNNGSYGQASNCFMGMFSEMGPSIAEINKNDGTPTCVAVGKSYAVSNSFISMTKPPHGYCVDSKGNYPNMKAVVLNDEAKCVPHETEVNYWGEGAPSYGVREPI